MILNNHTFPNCGALFTFPVRHFKISIFALKRKYLLLIVQIQQLKVELGVVRTNLITMSDMMSQMDPVTVKQTDMELLEVKQHDQKRTVHVKYSMQHIPVSHVELHDFTPTIVN